MKRAFVACALLALGGIGLFSPQVISASPPNCSAQEEQRFTDQPSRLPAPLAPTSTNPQTGCGGMPITDAPDNVFLCYSKFQVDPGVWPPDIAVELLAEGYYYPVAVPGNVPGGTNLGDYHLVCNAPAAASGEVVNQNGMVQGGEVAGDGLGYYPLGG